MKKLLGALISRVISALGLVTDGYGKKLCIGDSARIICKEHDGCGLPAETFGNFNPCTNSKYPRIAALRPNFLTESPAYLVLLDKGDSHPLWVTPKYLDKSACGLIEPEPKAAAR